MFRRGRGECFNGITQWEYTEEKGEVSLFRSGRELFGGREGSGA